MDAHRVQIEEEELLVDVFKAVLFVVDRPFRIAVVFLAVSAAVIVDIAFKARAFLVALVPFAAKGARLYARTATILVQLVVNDHVIHLHVLDLIVDIHEDDVSFDILRALACEIHIFVRLQKRLLQFDIDGIRNFTLLDFIKRFLRRHMDNLVALLDGITELVAHIVQALLHVNMDRIGTCGNEVRTNAHVPFIGCIFCGLVKLAERLFAGTIHKNQVHVELCHKRFFLVDGTAQAPEIWIQAKHFSKSLVAIERRQKRIVTGVFLLQQFRIRSLDIHVVKRVTSNRRKSRSGQERTRNSNGHTQS